VLPCPIDQLPVQLTALAPYWANVTTPSAGLLATHCLYIDGYRATVSRQSVDVLRSPRGYAAIPVPAGTSTVTLDYRGSGLLRLALGLTALAWIAACVVIGQDLRKGNRRTG
jgi:hypothetical protein